MDIMRAVQQLPQGYVRILSIDLQKEKKLFLTVNLIGLVIMAVLTIPMLFLVPIWALFDMSNGMGPYFVRFATLLVLSVVYMVLHELVHGITMKLCGTKHVKYGFTGAYAFAGSDDYYDKKSYIIIALAPVILWGIALAIVTPLVPIPWFWVVYFIQSFNLSGAAGDLYVTVKFARPPADILVKDDGVRMEVFSRQQ